MMGVNVPQAELQSTDQEPLIHLQRGRAGSGDSQGQRSLAGYSPQGRRVRHDWATKHIQQSDPGVIRPADYSLYLLCSQEKKKKSFLSFFFLFTATNSPPSVYSLWISGGREIGVVLVQLRKKTLVLFCLTITSCPAQRPSWVSRSFIKGPEGKFSDYS